jgi:hypothetical protein
MQAVLGAGDGAVVSHRVAAWVWGLDGVQEGRRRVPRHGGACRGRRPEKGPDERGADVALPRHARRAGREQRQRPRDHRAAGPPLGRLPRPVLHHVVTAADGFAAEVDLAYPDARLAVELDGYAVHGGADAFQHDRSRQNRLVLLGWTVVRFTWHDVVRRPEYVVATVERALAGAVPA